MFKKILTLSFLTFLMAQAATASVVGDLEPMSEETKARFQLFSADQRINDQLRSAPLLAKDEGRELHIILGAGPFEEHMNAVIKRDFTRENLEAEVGLSNPFKAPVRVFFTTDYRSKPDFSSDRNPLYYGNYNSLTDWSRLLELIHPNCRGKDARGKVRMFEGPVDKIYFDFSTVKFAEWDMIGMIRILALLKPEGSILVPQVNAASQSVFAVSQVTKAEKDALIKDPSPENHFILNSMAYGPDLAPKSRSSTFLHGMSLTNTEKRDGVDYVYNGKSLLYDTNYLLENMSERAKTLVAPLWCEFIPTAEGYPDIGGHDRPEIQHFGKQFFEIDNYVKVTKGKL